MSAHHEDEAKELLLRHAGENAGKVMKMKKKLQAKHEKGLLASCAHATCNSMLECTGCDYNHVVVFHLSGNPR